MKISFGHTQGTGIERGDKEADLAGETLYGRGVKRGDSIRLVNCR